MGSKEGGKEDKMPKGEGIQQQLRRAKIAETPCPVKVNDKNIEFEKKTKKVN